MNPDPYSFEKRGRSAEQPAPRQFSLLTLLSIVTGLAVLFGVLTWFGLKGPAALVGFASAGGAALIAIMSIELFKRIKDFWSERRD
jgi:hypothetical protein